MGEVTSQVALLQQVLDFLTTLSARQPLVLLLDDLHWADPASLDLLRFLARSLASLPLLLVATYRVDELTRRHPLYALLPVLVREAHAARLDLRPLDVDALRALIATRYRIGPADTARLIAYLQERAEGNPFFLGELLRTLEEEGVLRTSDDAWMLGDLTRVRVPALLRQVIDGRLARLGEESQTPLGVAAVIGQEVPFALWAAITDDDEEHLLNVVEQATAARIVEATADGAGFRFVHALIREALYESMLPLRRRVQHRKIGEALATMPDADPDAVAYHFQQGGDTRAITWLIKAGTRAHLANIYPIAIARFDAALALMDLASIGNTAERAWLLISLAYAFLRQQPHQGVTYFEAAARVAAHLGDPTLDAVVRHALGLSHCFVEDLARGVAEMRQSMAALDALSPDAWQHITSVLGISPDQTRSSLILYLASAGHFHEVVTLGEAHVPQALATGGWYRGLILAYTLLGHPERAEEPFQRACAIERAVRDYTNLGATCINYLETMLFYYADDLPGRQHIAEQGEWAWRQACTVYPDYQSPQFAWLPLLFVEGRWKELTRLIPSLRLPSPTHRWVIASVLGPFARLRGDTAGAWQRVREILPQGPATAPGNISFWTALEMQRLAAALALDAGDLPIAKEWLEAHDCWLAWGEAVRGQAEGQTLWAQYYRQAGDAAKTYQHAERALAHATEPRQPLALLAAHRLIGELDTSARQFAQAENHLHASLALADACAAPYERACTLLALAELRAATGNATEAATLLDAVRAICTPLGAKLALARADVIAARLTAMAATLTIYPDGLSAREAEVLRLIGAGQNNQEIADRLSLSIRTVERHITNIYGKIAARGRSDATAYALRHLP